MKLVAGFSAQGSGKLTSPGPGQHHVKDAEHASFLEDAADLGKQPVLVFDVHSDMHHVSPVKGTWLKRKIERARLLVCDTIPKTHSPRQSVRGANKIIGDVDAR